MTKKFIVSIVAAAMMVGSAAVQSAQAQTTPFQGCSCVVPSSPESSRLGAAVLGQIVQANGDVLALGNNGYRPAQANQSFLRATQVLTGPSGEALISFGGCSVSVGASQSVQVSLPAGEGGSFCVRVADVAPAQTGGQGQAAAGLGKSTFQWIAGGSVYLTGLGFLVYAVTSASR